MQNDIATGFHQFISFVFSELVQPEQHSLYFGEFVETSMLQTIETAKKINKKSY